MESLFKQLREERADLHAPFLFSYELAAVCRKIVHRGRLSSEEVYPLLVKMLGTNVTLHFDNELLLQAYRIAEKYGLPTAYDSQYLALAERLDCEYWTADKKLFDAVSEKASHIRWIGDWKV